MMDTSSIKNNLPDEIRFDTPGFISDQFYALDPKRFYIRTIFIPESFFIYLERDFIRLKGRKAKEELYRIGKKFGYRFAIFNKFPKGNINKIVMHSIYQFFEIAYAKKITTNMLDPTNKILEIYAEELAITNRSGFGYTLTLGGWCGIWCYLNADYSLEISYTKISKNVYSLISGPRKLLRYSGAKIIESDKIPEAIDLKQYMENNTPKITSSKSITSFKRLFGRGFMYYKPGRIMMMDSEERIIPLEVSLLFDLEKGIEEKIVYDSAYYPFYKIGSLSSKNVDAFRFLCDLFTAFGFGIVDINEIRDYLEIKFVGYPWFTLESEKANFAYIRGAVIGFLNSRTGKNHSVSSLSARKVGDTFTVTLDIKTR